MVVFAAGLKAEGGNSQLHQDGQIVNCFLCFNQSEQYRIISVRFKTQVLENIVPIHAPCGST